MSARTRPPTCLRRRRALRDDRGVSPIVGVILMVAVTVVLGATVYSWVSAYGAVPTKSVRVLGFVADGPPEGAEGEAAVRTLTVVAAMPGLTHGDLVFLLDGAPLARADGCAAAPAADQVAACRGGALLEPDASVRAGDEVRVLARSGQTLRIADHASGAILFVQRIT